MMTTQQLRYVVPITRTDIVYSTVTNLTDEKSKCLFNKYCVRIEKSLKKYIYLKALTPAISVENSKSTMRN